MAPTTDMMEASYGALLSQVRALFLCSTFGWVERTGVFLNLGDDWFLLDVNGDSRRNSFGRVH